LRILIELILLLVASHFGGNSTLAPRPDLSVETVQKLFDVFSVVNILLVIGLIQLDAFILFLS
jgi:hypothetical protein